MPRRMRGRSVQKESQLSTSRQYELVYIITPEASDQEVADLHTQIEQIIERFKGTLDKTENWGRRKLAYDIGRHREGTYVVETITGSGELMKEIDRRLRVSDAVIRHLVVRVDRELQVADRTRSARQTAAARRRVARGLPPERQPGEGRGDGDQNDDMEGAEGHR
jgi:small subunit ribosomal protein S6